MTAALVLILVCILAASGFAMIAVSQPQHRKLLRLPFTFRSPLRLRSAGGILIALSAVPAVMHDGWAFGLVLWVMMLSVAAFLVVAVLTNMRRRG